MNFKIVSVLLFLTIVQWCQCKNYSNFALYKAIPMTLGHVQFLTNVEKKKYIEIIFWKRPQKLFEEVHFVVNPKDENEFIERSRHFGLTAELVIDNLQSAFDAQLIKRSHVKSYNWRSYHSLEDIYQWLADLIIRYPRTAVLETIGKTVEGKDIYALGVTSPNNLGIVIVEGGIHGNEWIGTECVTYIANEILKAKEHSTRHLHDIANLFTWYFIPVVNPDGYNYCQTTDRMWYKNRRPLEKGLYGVDLNRNFDYNFGKFDSSNDTLDDHYCGESPISEPEVQALTKFILKKSRRLRFYFSLHSYGEKIIIPYGDRIKHVENYSEMENYAKQAILKIYKMNGIKYMTGTYYDTLGFKISGNSAGWVKSALKVRYVFTFLLRDNGTFGYALPADQILPTCQETFRGIIEIMTARPRRLQANVFTVSQATVLNGVCKVLVICSVFLSLLHLFVE